MEMVFCYYKPGPCDKPFMALGTIGTISKVPRNVTNVNISKPHFKGNLPRLLQYLDRGGWETGKFIGGEEAVKV